MRLLSYVDIAFGMGVVFLTTTLPASAVGLVLPCGWRLPNVSQISGDWRKDDPDHYFIVRGDFNGDGVADQAMLLVSEEWHGLRLFAFLSQQNGAYKIYALDNVEDMTLAEVMGISKASPGKYKTACGKGYWECGKDEIPELIIHHDAINYFKWESANSFYYWDSTTESFKRIWISD